MVFVNSMSDLFHTRVPFFFKQWGGVRKHLNGRELDGTVYDEVPDRHYAELQAEQLVAADAR